jgi:hypothetical protein
MIDFLRNLRRNAQTEKHAPQGGEQSWNEGKEVDPRQHLENEKRHDSAKNYLYFNQMVK